MSDAPEAPPGQPPPKPKNRRDQGKPRRKVGRYAQRPGLRDEQVEKALRATAGIYRYAATKLKCAPNTVRNHVLKSPRLQEVLSEIANDTGDLVEHKIVEKIKRGDRTMLIFYAKCKLKDRGYVERQELTGPSGGPIELSSVLDLRKRMESNVVPVSAAKKKP